MDSKALIILSPLLLLGCLENDRKPYSLVEHANNDRSHALTKSYDKCKRLAEQMDINGLREIANSKDPYGYFAISELGRLLSSADAVALCRSYEGKLGLWEQAFGALGCHEKSRVIDYILEMARSSNPAIRKNCYDLCQDNRWPELIPYAREDLGSQVKLFWIQMPVHDVTLGDCAKAYLDAFQE